MMKAPPICKECGNNACYLYPHVWAKKHLKSKNAAAYQALVKAADDFLIATMPAGRREWLRRLSDEQA